jgi:hypothetical protein
MSAFVPVPNEDRVAMTTFVDDVPVRDFIHGLHR